jgi:uncharacterized Tic20 family protein
MHIPSAHEATSDERILAAVAHGSVILFGWGAIAAIVLWITQRQKSAFVAFHSLQALMYQLLQTVYILLVMPVAALVLVGAIAGIAALSYDSASRADPTLVIVAQFAFLGSIFCGFGLYILVGLVAAVLVLSGRDFHYPLIGRRMQRHLADEPSSVKAEDA